MPGHWFGSAAEPPRFDFRLKGGIVGGMRRRNPESAPPRMPSRLPGPWRVLAVALALACASAGLLRADAAAGAPDLAKAGPKRVFVIPIRDEIAQPTLFVLRRGLKDAVSQHADAVVLDIKTPGGAIDVTMEMMDDLKRFPGTTIAFVDNEAMSAGAFISAVCDEIWFVTEPTEGIIGAAAPVQGSGQDIDATMKEKLVSYLKVRMRAISQGKGHRGEVISAMIDADMELKIDGEEVKIDGRPIKDKGALLSLTATEAMHPVGTPPRPLLGAGEAKDMGDLLDKRFGKAGYTKTELTATWSEGLAVSLNRLAPAMLGLGIFALFIGFKSQGFGGFIAIGVALLTVVFLSSYVSGLSGHEPVIIFSIGLLLLLAEVLFFHSAGFLGVIGFLLMLGSLFWAMADLWPGEPIQVAWSANAFLTPLINIGLGLGIAIVLGASLLRFLPSGWVWDRLTVTATVGGSAQAAGSVPSMAPLLHALVGRRGTAATALRPGGQVDLDGRRFEAKVAVGAIDSGTSVIVVGHSDFELVVEKAPDKDGESAS
jgi:membrane-bound serine protease (ClpP class)